MERCEVVVVGGGPAGAAVAIGLALRGRDVVVVERAPAYRWRACGVFSSPLTIPALARLGVAPGDLATWARRVPAMRVETRRGTTFRLTYGDDGSLRSAPVGLDRSRLDPGLVDLARAAGADVREGVAVRSVDSDGQITLASGSGFHARVVVGADGLRSIVARDAGVARRPPLGNRSALTFHVVDPRPETMRDARMIAFDGGYVGLAPVPGGRVNVGIVLASRSWRDRLRTDGASAVAADIMAGIPPADDDPVPWQAPEICDEIVGVAPVGSRVARRAGPGWLLIGDAAGFLDPFTGEGLQRALRTAAIATDAIDRFLGGDAAALAAYDRAVARRTRGKDLVSLVVQAFLEVPDAFELVARHLAGRPVVRETMGLVMGDLVPASRALDPRFLAALLRP